MALEVSDNDVKVANAALAAIGVSRGIGTFLDNSHTARTLNATYLDVLEDAMSMFPYRFCSRRIKMNRLSDTPPEDWEGLYQLPEEIILPHTVYVDGDVRKEFDVFEDRIAVNEGDTSTAVVEIEGNVMVSPLAWDSTFRRGFILYLAGAIAIPILKDPKTADYYTKLGMEKLGKAASRSAQARKQRKLDTKLFIKQRRSGGTLS